MQVKTLVHPSGETRDVLQGTQAAFTPEHHECDVTVYIRSYGSDAEVDFSVDGGETYVVQEGFVQGIQTAGESAAGGFPREGYDQHAMVGSVPPNSRLMLNIRSQNAGKIIYAVVVGHCREI